METIENKMDQKASIEMVQKLDEKVQYLEGSVKRMAQDVSSTNSKINMARTENEERQKKTKNIIIRGVQENEEADDHDEKIVTEVLKDIGCNSCDIIKTYRLGKKPDGSSRSRPIRVILKSEEEKWKVVGRATKIRQVQTDLYEPSKIYIVPDMTKLERDQDVELRRELKKKREDFPNDRYTIRKGKIIKV